MSTNDKKEMFKTAFKGFDKKGVTEFIRLLSSKYDEDIASKAKELENYKDSLLKAEKSAKALEAEKNLLEEQLKSERQENLSLKSQLENLQSAASSDAEAEIAALKEKLEIMKSAQLTAKLEIEAEKAKIAETIITAERLAKTLQEEAVANSMAQKAEIEKQIISRKSELLGINGEIERMKAVFSDLYNKYVSK